MQTEWDEMRHGWNDNPTVVVLIPDHPLVKSIPGQRTPFVPPPFFWRLRYQRVLRYFFTVHYNLRERLGYYFSQILPFGFWMNRFSFVVIIPKIFQSQVRKYYIELIKWCRMMCYVILAVFILFFFPSLRLFHASFNSLFSFL